MDFEQAKEKVLGLLKEKGRAKNSEMTALLEQNQDLFEQVKEDLIFEDLADDKKGVGLIYTGSENTIPKTESPADIVPAQLPESPDNCLNIFLSYGHDEHASLAVKLKADLESRGHKVWFDEDRLKPGGDWETYIEEGLDWVGHDPSCGRVVLLMTPHSMRRPDGYCLNEIARAIDRRVNIVPVMVAQVEPPLSICRIQWLDMQDCVPIEQRTEKYEIRFSLLAQALEQGKTDVEGSQAKLHLLLDPLPFDADIKQHLPRFTGRRWIYEKIVAWLDDPDASRIFWITGGPGIGKTAIASKLCAEKREVGAFHICRHGHDQKADPRHVVKSIAFQLASQLPEYRNRLVNLREIETLVKEHNARTLFDRLLVQPLHSGFPAPDRTIILLIDGLDEATRNGGNDLADFLSHEFAKMPDWIRMILTSRPEIEVMQPLQGLEPVVIEADSKENIKDIIEYIHKEFAPFAKDRKIPDQTVQTIIDKSEGVFLYVEWVRRELPTGRLSLDNADAFPKGLGGVYARFFNQKFADIHAYKQNYRPLLETITAAHEPLHINYLAELFNWSAYDREEIPEALGSLFPIVQERIRPFHRTISDWLTKKQKAGAYFVSKDLGNQRLADKGWQEYTRGIDSMSDYARTCLPKHLIHVQRWKDVVQMLTDLAYLETAWENDPNLIRACWVEIENQSDFTMQAAYQALADKPEGAVLPLLNIGELLYGAGHMKTAKALFLSCIEKERRSADKTLLPKALKQLGWVLKNTGRLDQAMALLKEAEQICRKTGNREELQRILGNRGNILNDRGDLDGAMALYKAQEKICRELGLKNSLQTCIGNKGSILKIRGDLDDAMALYKTQEKICRELGLTDGLQSCLGNQGNILKTRGDLDGAMTLYKEKEKICRELGLKDSLQICLGNQGNILNDRGNPDGAIGLYNEKEKICRELGLKDGLQSCLGAQGNILSARGDLNSAMALHKEEEEICRELGLKDSLQICLGNQGIILKDRGDLDGAMALYKEKEKICRELGVKDSLQICLGYQAAILIDSGQEQEALPLLKMQEELCLELGKKASLIPCYANMGLVCSHQGNLEDAMAYHKKEEAICLELDSESKLARCYGYQAGIFSKLEDKETALMFFKKQEDICRKLNTPQGLAMSLANQAIITAFDLREPEQARAMAREACDLAQKHGFDSLIENLEAINANIDRMLGFSRP